MSAEKQETIADIVAQLRAVAHIQTADTPRSVMQFADRIEAAVKREELRWATANGELARMIDLEKVQGYNAAAMREAVDKIQKLVTSDRPADEVEIANICRAALAKPPRNCDVFKSEDEAKSAFIAYYNETFGLNGSIDEIGACDLKHNVDGICHDYIQWLLAPATERKGEEDGSK